MGYEVIQGYDGWNDNFSRSSQFGYAIPFTHTGAKASYAGEKASVMLTLVNGWDNVKDNNSGKSVGAQLLLTPAKTVSLYVNWIGGPEQAESSRRLDVVEEILVLKRAELRRDWSDEPVFDAKNGPQKDQTTVAVNRRFAC